MEYKDYIDIPDYEKKFVSGEYVLEEAKSGTDIYWVENNRTLKGRSKYPHTDIDINARYKIYEYQGVNFAGFRSDKLIIFI